MDILVAPWGNPKDWKVVTYNYNGKSFSSFSSSLALANLLNIAAKDTYIILSSTLISDACKDYNELVNKIKDNIYNFISGRDPRVTLPNLLVSIGIGKFTKTIHKGNIDLYHNYIYFNILSILKNTNNANKVNIHLDLTHGINYMPSLAKDAVELASATYAAISGHKVNLHVYNSDPLSPMPKEDNPAVVLNVNKIMEIRYDGYTALLPLLLRFTLNYDDNYYIWKRISNKELDIVISEKDMKKIYKASKAASMGLLLVVGYLMEELTTYYKYINGLFDDLFKKNNIEMECNNDKEAIIFDYKTKLLKEASLLHSTLEALVSLKVSKNIKLTELEELGEKYYKTTMDPLYALIGQEKECLNKYKDDIPTEPIIYGRLKYKDKFDNSKMCKPNKRNLYAHVGFEENVMHVSKDSKDNEIYLSYGDCFNEILNHI